MISLGVPGNEMLQNRLSNYLIGGRHHPAAILTGNDIKSRWQLAKNVAKFFLCTAKQKNKLFCDQCSHCVRIEKEIHPDVLMYIDKEEDSIKIDSIRDICHQMEVGPIEQQYKICLIDECHRMTTASANALLKTLEEPGQGRFFWLLTSQPSLLLPTVLSRCLKFRMAQAQSSVEFPKEFDSLWSELKKHRDPSKISGEFESKESASSFVNFIQAKLREETLSKSDASFREMSDFFDSIEVESRLRSNANHTLIVENFIHRII